MLKIPPPVWFFLFLIIALLFHFAVPATHIFHLDGMLYNVVGIIVFLVGMVISNIAAKRFAEEKTEVLPTSATNRVLIVNSVYTFSRNPMYLGMVVSLLGVGLFVGTLPVFVAALADFLLLNFAFIPFEEQKMARQFGEAYTAYKNSVRRWI